MQRRGEDFEHGKHEGNGKVFLQKKRETDLYDLSEAGAVRA